jgi:glycosyltransferase involved in cell wall biosynthesis
VSGDVQPLPQRLLMTADAVGGVWHYSLDLGAALASEGMEVTLAVMGPGPDEAQRREAADAALRLEHRPYRLEWMDDPWSDVRKAGDWLLQLAAETRADVVHLNGYAHAALPWTIPTVVVGHSCVRSWWRAVHRQPAPSQWDRYSAAVAAGLSAASVVVTPTSAMLACLCREYSLPAGEVVANGSSAVNAARRTPGDKRHIVFSAGRFWDEAKNISALASAASAVEWPVIVAGPGTGGQTAGLRGLGTVPRRELHEWLAQAAIYALPARYEPFGLSILEAAAHGCALVLGRIDSLEEQWAEAALFVPPDEPRALSRAINQLIADVDLRAHMQTLAMARASQFTVPRMMQGYVRQYAAALTH